MAVTDRKLNVLLIIIALLAAASVAVAAFTAPSIIAGKNNTDAVLRGNDFATCRSQFGAVLTDARNATDDARDQVFVDIVTAIQSGRSDPAATQALLNASVSNLNDKREGRNVANDDYQAALQLSKDDPTEFLRQCAALPGG